jgi:hypothetical protein
MMLPSKIHRLTALEFLPQFTQDEFFFCVRYADTPGNRCRIRGWTRPIEMLRQFRALFLAGGVGIFEGRNVGLSVGAKRSG